MVSRCLLLALGALVTNALVLSSPFAAQTCVPFSSIVAGSASDYDAYQIKFTWVGEQLKIKKTFGVTGSLTTFSAASFQPCLLTTSDYNNDQVPAETITLSGAEIQRFINTLSQRPELQTSSVPPDGVLSLQIRRPSGPNSIVFEHISTKVGTRTLLLLLLDSLDPGSTVEEETIIRAKRVYVGSL